MKSSCLNIDQLIAYINKTISPEDREMVEKHLSHCDKCLEMVSMTSQMIHETIEVQASQKIKECVEQVKESIKDFYQWAKDQIPPLWVEPSFQPELALASVRSNHLHTSQVVDKNIYIKQSMNNLTTEMFFEQSAGGLISIKIRATQNNQIAQQVFIYMKAKGKGPSARRLKPPYVSFDDIPFGIYCILVEQNNEEKGAFCFEVNDNGIYGK
jgi:uncharacterized protein YdhG (YjbR/CyaY superfamily)